MAKSSNHLQSLRKDRPTIKDIQLTEDGTKAHFTVPGPPLDFCNAQGNPRLEKIGKIFECARVVAAHNPEYIFRKSVGGAHKTAFIVLVNMDIDRTMYQRGKANKYTWPMDLTTTLTAFGKTSIDYISFIEDNKDGETLATLKFKYTSVDLNTRKATPLSPDIKNTYSHRLKPSLAVQSYQPASRPIWAYPLTIKIHSSDIDQNLHVNNSVYLRMCEDCAADARHNGALKNFQGDVLGRQVRNVQALYQSECLFEELPTVYCWEDSDHTDILHFEILKKDGKISFCCKLTFYPVGVPRL